MTLSANLSLYRSTVSQLRPGDCVACCGGGKFPKIDPVSLLIRGWTGSRFTHIIVVVSVFKDLSGNWDAWISQSTIDKVSGQTVSGVQTSLLSQVLTNEYGDSSDLAYGLRLQPRLSAQIDPAKLKAFTDAYAGKTLYDVWGYAAFGLHDIPIIGSRVAQSENYKRQFCSAWWIRTMLNFDVLRGINFSDEAPSDVVRHFIWAQAIQLWGDATPIEKIEPLWNSWGRAA
jgi:hypothetical protein